MNRQNEKQTELIPEEQLIEKIADASKTIFSYCMARTPNRTEAEDLCQDILCELVRSSENIRDSKAFYGFMWAVAGNVYRQWCRKRAGLQTCELDDDIPSGEDLPDMIPDDEENSDIYLLRRELSLLAEKYRQAVILYYMKRKSCFEISRLLSINENRVKYLLFKSRKILKEGMNMERKLGELSYNPKDLVPMYRGSGPNRFWEFMQGRIRQNIVQSCYNDSLTQEQISLETGIPLPYMDSEINALTEKGILIREGTHYKANIIILTAECMDEIIRNSAPCHKESAELINEFVDENIFNFKQIGFVGADFTENTLRWQLLSFLVREIRGFDAGENEREAPVTVWGDRAYLWLAEQGNALENDLFNFCQVESRRGDRIRFMDYLPFPRGSHRDFYGNDYLINILCDIAHGDCVKFSEYDLEAAAELLRKGYVLKERDRYTDACPLFTKEQYAAACRLAEDFVAEKMTGILKEMNRLAFDVLSAHTPRHLQKQVLAVSSTVRDMNAVGIPVKLLLERKALSTEWNPLEMPGMHIELGE